MLEILSKVPTPQIETSNPSSVPENCIFIDPATASPWSKPSLFASKAVINLKQQQQQNHLKEACNQIPLEAIQHQPSILSLETEINSANYQWQ